MSHLIPTETEYSPAFVFEVKELTEDGIFEGYSSTFGNKDLGGDVIERGAFAETLKEHGGRVPILFNHSWMKPIGYGIDAKEDDRGLFVRGEFTLGSTDGRDAYETAKHAQRRKQPHGLSIGYSVRGDEGAAMRGDVRRLKAVNLHEYSMAVFPMNPKARIREVKSGATRRECEEYLRGFGMSQLEAKKLISAVEATRDVDAPTYTITSLTGLLVDGLFPTRDVDGKCESFLRDLQEFALLQKMREFTSWTRSN